MPILRLCLSMLELIRLEVPEAEMNQPTAERRIGPMSDLARAVFLTLPDGRMDELELQEAVMMFQTTGSQIDFDLVRERYDPLRYKNRWFASYGHLFDEEADFDGQMMECFVKACSRFEPDRSLNPFYWGILRTTFANKIKHRSAKIRNPQVRCPICEELVGPLGTHVLEKHPELVAQVLRDHRMDPVTVHSCPFCRDKIPVVFSDEVHRAKHFRARHSSMIFAAFMRLYPGHHTAIRDPAPPIGSIISNPDDGDSGFDPLEDMGVTPVFKDSSSEPMVGGASLMSILSDDRLSDCQRAMVESVLHEDVDGIPSPDRLCKICLETKGECPRGPRFKLNRQRHADELDELREIASDYI